MYTSVNYHYVTLVYLKLQTIRVQSVGVCSIRVFEKDEQIL